MMRRIAVFVGLMLLPALVWGGEKEDFVLKNEMIPLARDFLTRNGLSEADFGTNAVKKFSVDFFTDGRPGYTALLTLTQGYYFDFRSDGTNREVGNFSAGIKNYYDLTFAPKEKIAAVQALNLRNKLNDATALELAKKFFKLQGHKEEDFQPPEFHQLSWIIQNERDGSLPYYRAEWYRKDVKAADKKRGIATLPIITIEVSGINTNLIYYFKGFMPVCKDF